MSGRCWPPIRIASSNPAVITSTVGSPRRSSSAFVATVVPILTAETVRSLSGAAGEQPLDAGDGRVLVAAGIDGQAASAS